MQHAIQVEIDVFEFARYLGKSFGEDQIPTGVDLFTDYDLWEQMHEELGDGLGLTEVIEGAFSSACLRALIKADTERDHPLYRELLAMTLGTRGPIWDAFVVGVEEALKVRVASDSDQLGAYLEWGGRPADISAGDLEMYLRDPGSLDY